MIKSTPYPKNSEESMMQLTLKNDESDIADLIKPLQYAGGKILLQNTMH